MSITYEYSALGTHEICQRCGAQIETGKTGRHSRWHGELEALLGGAERLDPEARDE